MRIPPKTELSAWIFGFSVWAIVLYNLPLECIVKSIITISCLIAYAWITASIIQYIMRKINKRRNNIIIKRNETRNRLYKN